MRLSGGDEKRGNDGLISKEWKLVGWAGGFLVVSGYYLNADFNIYCWLAWIIGNSMIGSYCYKAKAYPAAAMSLALVLMNIYGFISWLDK